MPSSFLHLDGLHVFITGAAGNIGSRAVQEFLDQGCRVTAHDVKPAEIDISNSDRLHAMVRETSFEKDFRSSMEEAQNRFGPINILVANFSVSEENSGYPIWSLPVDVWDRTYRVNARDTYIAIKQFLLAAKFAQENLENKELENLSIVIAANGRGSFSQTGLQYGLLKELKSEILQVNRKARINSVVPGWLDNISSNEGDSISRRKAVRPNDFARAIAFLSSHHAAGHITGECLAVDTQMEGRLIWKANEVVKISEPSSSVTQSISRPISQPTRNKIRVAVSIDLDAVSGWLGTGYSPENVLADYSAGFFAAQVGVPRLLNMLKRVGIADKVTWFIPGHSAESFPQEVQQVVASGCEIGLHGYAHEGAYSLTVQQERDILERCIQIATKLTGKRPIGYRAPLYQVRESTLDLLEEYGFEYDASLTDHDSHPFFAPRRPALQPIDYTKPASSWMHPVPPPSKDQPQDRRPLVEVPCNYYMEDMTPMQFLPHVHNSHGYVDVRSIEQMWRDRFLWIREHEENPIFAMLMHPDTSGMAHVIGMVERMIRWVQSWGGEVEFMQTGDIARWWRENNLTE